MDDTYARRPCLALLLSVIAAFGTPAIADPTPAPPPEGSRPGLPSDDELERAGAVIGAIRFNIGNIFDESDPRENKLLFRLANDLHIVTKEQAIRAQLLFAEGDPYSARLLAETERNLRNLDYLHDARVRPVAFDGQKVDVEVQTRDVWSLQPGISFSRKGGENSVSAEIEEENVLGYGKNLQFTWGKDVQRRSVAVQWRDPNVWGSHWLTDLGYSQNDDGHLRSLLLERPFYSLDTRWSAGVQAFDFTRVDPRYDLGHIVDEFHHDEQVFELRGGLSAGLVNGWVRRWLFGFRYDDDKFALEPGRTPPDTLPPDHKLVYPWMGVSWRQEKFAKTRNLNRLGRTEDLDFGTAFSFAAGYSSETIGADRDAVILAMSASQGYQLNDYNTLFVDADANGRLESGAIANGILNTSGRYFWRWRPARVFYAAAQYSASERLDLETQLQLGGDNGLRGYPLRYQTGTSRGLVTVEQRFFTDWFPFRLFYVGAAVFADVGRTWGTGAVGEGSLGWLKDVGVGLRLGNARGGFGNVIHIDVAVPLDRTPEIDKWQILVETKATF